VAGGFFIVLDDIAMMFDDVAVMSKVAAKKTAALLGDDLAVNAEKATGFHASRELPVIWAITKGSMVNKLIILPLAFLLNAYMQWLIVPILLLGGAYLSFEGVEKIHHWMTGHKAQKTPPQQAADSAQRLQHEALKVKEAIRTDFILSIEIVFIALETVMLQSLVVQVMVVSFIALLATVGVYGVVALMVRMDDVGAALMARAGTAPGFYERGLHYIGKTLVASLPKLIRLLTVVGTIAMLLVGGGMYLHNIETVEHFLSALPTFVASLLIGLVIGTVIVLFMHLFKLLKCKFSPA